MMRPLDSTNANYPRTASRCFCSNAFEFECGLHGRFEYCIDGFPGCVIGCHCYPGYYFDTDSKICEPNTKLTQDYRRHMPLTGYNLHGGSGMVVAAPPAPEEPRPAATDGAQESQDHGDLSDWLYNQFFKTIESQVVNKTDDDEPLKTPTRRSGGGALIEPFVTRRHKSNKKRKPKRRGSRKKIIRLDDDESEDDSSDSSGSDSDEDDDGNLGSWERFEWGPSNRPPSAGKDPAAHREIVMYSKKPKPPLPSFIFLPNMQTPFFPPIGLPGALPMYPMVPVPPINPGLVPTECSENDETTSTMTTQGIPSPATAATAATAPPAPSSVTPPAPTTTSPVDQKKALRNQNLNKIHQKFRNKPPKQVHNPPPKPTRPLPPPPGPGDADFSIKAYDDIDYDALFMGDNSLLFGPDMPAAADGTDFKYLSELIHKDNGTTTPPTPKRNSRKYEQFLGKRPHETKRRHPIPPGRLDDFNTRRQFDPRMNGEDDSYYSSLGKQIAKLIRGLDSKGIHDADIKIEPVENPISSNPFFSESSYGSRSYWERFVRSPLSLRLDNFSQYGDLTANNEELFELENQVQEATTPPALSLQELENVINTMGSLRNHVHKPELENNDKLSNGSLNVSLLPQINARDFNISPNPSEKMDKPEHNTVFRKDVEQFTQEVINQVQPDKRKDPNKESKKINKNTEARTLPGSIHLNTHIHKLRNFYSTKGPKLLASHVKGKEHDARKISFKHNWIYGKSHTPHLIAIADKTTVVKSNKYFVDENSNYQMENWPI